MEKRRGELKGMVKKGKPQKVPALEVNWEEEGVIAVAGGGGVEEDKKRKLSSFSGSVTCSSSSSSTTTSLGCSRKGVGVGGVQQPCCQAEKCTADLTEAKRYHRRHRVCEVHFKATAVIVAGLRQRFCQQCSRFHELSEFDKSKRSCRRRLAGHNERRRKVSSDSQGEDSDSTRRLQTDHSGKSQMSCLVGAPTYKDLQIK